MKEKSSKNNYYKRAFLLVALVLLFTLFFSVIPRFVIFNTETKKVDILSEVRPHSPEFTTDSKMDSTLYSMVSDEVSSSDSSLLKSGDTTTLLENSTDNNSKNSDHKEAANSNDTAPKSVAKNSSLKEVLNEKVQKKIDSIVESEPIIKEIKDSNKIIELEDFSEGKVALDKFRKAINNIDKQRVGVGLIGDSFIEGDILSSDIREMLQDEYGGNGVGFVPTTSIVSKYRATISHTYSGWKRYTIKSKNSAAIDNKFIISSTISVPLGDTTTVDYKITNVKRHLKNVTSASFYFINEGEPEITAIINGSEIQSFTPESSPVMQRIVLTPKNSKNINSLSLKFKNVANLYTYGVSFDNEKGIFVDNFSERGSSGMPLSKLSALQNTKFNEFEDYKLIILQFGLNILSYGRYEYTFFENKLVSVINNIKACYPNASIVIMGISDRNIKVDDEYVPMLKELESMGKHQRNIAKRTGSLYWSTCDAMSLKGGIKTFVENKWASADHTHVNVVGARVIAEQFVKSLKAEIEDSNK